MTDPEVKALASRIHGVEDRIAAMGRSRQLTASSIPVTVEGDDGPLIIDVPLTAGVSQGMQAASKAEAALEEAREAIEAAANAEFTSSGKNARRRGQTEPEPPPGGWVQGDQWIVDDQDGKPYEVRVWNGTEFVHEQLLASELLVVSSGGVVRLADGTVTAENLVADAIDGMIITGARLRTAATGQRLEFDTTGITGYNSSNQRGLGIAPDGRGLVMRQDANNYISFNPASGLRYVSNQAPNGDGSMILEPDMIEMTRSGAGARPSMRLEHAQSGSEDIVRLWSVNANLRLLSGGDMRIDSGATDKDLHLGFERVNVNRLRTNYVEPMVGDAVEISATYGAKTAKVIVDGNTGGTDSGISLQADEILLDAPKVTIQGDTDWIQLDGWTGGFAHGSGSPVKYRRRNGYVEFIGSLTNSGWSGNYTSFGASLPPGFRPVQNSDFGMPTNSTVVRTVQFRVDGGIYLYGNVNSGAWWNFSQARFPIS